MDSQKWAKSAYETKKKKEKLGKEKKKKL